MDQFGFDVDAIIDEDVPKAKSGSKKKKKEKGKSVKKSKSDGFNGGFSVGVPQKATLRGRDNNTEDDGAGFGFDPEPALSKAQGASAKLAASKIPSTTRPSSRSTNDDELSPMRRRTNSFWALQPMANWPGPRDRIELNSKYFSDKNMYKGGLDAAYQSEVDASDLKPKKKAKEDAIEKMKARFQKTLVALGCRKSMTDDGDGDGVLKLDTNTGTGFTNVLTALHRNAASVGVLDFLGSGAKQATYISMQPVEDDGDDDDDAVAVSYLQKVPMATNSGDYLDVDEVEGGELMVQKLVKDLGYQPPRLLISMSGASVSNEEFPLKVRKILKNGFSETSDTWIITSGLNSGVAKLASTVAAEVRSSPGFNQAALPVIGITRDPSDGKRSESFYRYQYEPRSGSDLEASHSHFFLVQCESNTADAALDSTRDAFEDAFKEAGAFQKLIKLQNERKKAYEVFAEHDEHDDEDAFMHLATRISTLQILVGGEDSKSADITLHTVLTAIRDAETISPVVLLEGTGGITDVLAYAWRLYNDSSFEAARHTEETLDRMVRKTFQLYGHRATPGPKAESDQDASEIIQKIVTCVAVADKVYVFPVEESDGRDLDTIMLKAIMAHARPHHLDEDAAGEEGKSEFNNLLEQYEMDRNMVIMAMSMARIGEVKIGLDRARTGWNELKSRVGQLPGSEAEILNTPSCIPFDEFVFKALEWALLSAPSETDSDHVLLVKLLVEKLDSLKLECSNTSSNQERPVNDSDNARWAGVQFGLPALLYDLHSKRTRKGASSAGDTDRCTMELLYKALYDNDGLPHLKELLKAPGGKGSNKDIPSNVLLEFSKGKGLKLDHLGPAWGLIIKLFYDSDEERIPSIETWTQYCRHTNAEITETDLAEAGDLLACQELMIWSILAKHYALAEYFWQKGGHSIANALVASQICTQMTCQPELSGGSFTHIILEYETMAHAFEEHAMEVLSMCYNRDTDLTRAILQREVSVFQWMKIEDGDYYDCLELAQNANDMNFISDPSCQSLIDQQWNRKAAKHTGHFAYLASIYDKANAPCWKFNIKFLFYVLLLVLYTAIALTEFVKDDEGLYALSDSEWLLAFWFLVAVVDEVFEFAGNGINVKALKVYLNVWNMLDLVMYVVYWTAFSIRYQNQDNDALTRVAKSIYGINIMIGYFRVYQFLYISPTIGPKIEIFLRLFKELVEFLILIFLFIISYGVFVQTITHPFTPTDGNMIMRVFYRPYFQMYGELMLDDLSAETDCLGTTLPFSGCGEGNTGSMIAIVTGLYLIFTSIMLLNMLIAAFTNTYEKVSEQSTKIYLMKRFEMLLENQSSTLAPVPLNAPILAWNLLVLLQQFLAKQMSGSAAKAQDDLLSSFDEVQNDVQAEELQEAVSDLYIESLVSRKKQQTDSQLESLSTKVDYTIRKVEALAGSLNTFYQKNEKAEVANQANIMSSTYTLNVLNKELSNAPDRHTGEDANNPGVPPHTVPGQPNQFLVHIITRWKRDDAGNRIVRSGLPLLEFVAVKRSNEMDKWAIPELQYKKHNMEPEESPAIIQAFGRHNLMSHISPAEKDRIMDVVEEWIVGDEFGHQEQAKIYQGPVWDEAGKIEVKVEHFHDSGNLFEAFQLSAAKKPAAAEVSWITVSKNLSLCGHQSKFLHAAADKLHAYW
jgi:hypothetical protein